MSEGDDGVDGTDNGDDSALPGGATQATPEPTAQSSALRRQQFLVGVGGGFLAGAAAAASLAQQFPDVPLPVPLLAGLLVAYGIVRLAAHSIFPGETLK